MSRPLRISVALATFNGAPYLGEQLDSLVLQTRLPDELVVTDDGSTDGTAAIVERFASSVPFAVRLTRNKERLGYARNFEKAVSQCEGDVIFLCDQDDRWDADKLAVMSAEMAADPAIMVLLCDARLCDENLVPRGRTQYGNLKALGHPDLSYFMGCASSMRAEWARAMLPVPQGLTHDYWLIQMAHAAGAARILKLPLQDYRRHGSNESRSPLSSIHGAGPVDLIRGHGLDDVRASWREAVTTLDEAVARIEAAGFADSMKASLLSRRDAFARRIDACSTPRMKRPVKVFRMWREGDFHQFLGWKSLAKDLVRP